MVAGELLFLICKCKQKRQMTQIRFLHRIHSARRKRKKEAGVSTSRLAFTLRSVTSRMAPRSVCGVKCHWSNAALLASFVTTFAMHAACFYLIGHFGPYGMTDGPLIGLMIAMVANLAFVMVAVIYRLDVNGPAPASPRRRQPHQAEQA